MVNSREKVQIDISIYGVQTVHPTVQFTGINHTMCGSSVSGNLSIATCSFVLFGYDEADPHSTFRSLVYSCARNLISTPYGVCIMCVVIPDVIRLGTERDSKVDMNTLVEGVITSLQFALDASSDVVKTCKLKLYFQVPLSMKDALTNAIEMMP